MPAGPHRQPPFRIQRSTARKVSLTSYKLAVLIDSASLSSGTIGEYCILKNKPTYGFMVDHSQANHEGYDNYKPGDTFLGCVLFVTLIEKRRYPYFTFDECKLSFQNLPPQKTIQKNPFNTDNQEILIPTPTSGRATYCMQNCPPWVTYGHNPFSPSRAVVSLPCGPLTFYKPADLEEISFKMGFSIKASFYRYYFGPAGIVKTVTFDPTWKVTAGETYSPEI